MGEAGDSVAERFGRGENFHNPHIRKGLGLKGGWPPPLRSSPTQKGCLPACPSGTCPSQC